MDREVYDRQIRALGSEFNNQIQSLEVCVRGGKDLLIKKEICKHLILLGVSKLYCDIALQKYFSRTTVCAWQDATSQSTLTIIVDAIGAHSN